MKKPSQRIIDFIHSFEGYHRALPNGDCTAYPDPGNTRTGEPWTIGWGTTTYRTLGLSKYGRTKVTKGDTLTREQALSEFNAAVAYVASQVNRINPNLTQNQFDVAVSFMFNAGTGTKQSDRLRAGDLKGFEAALPLYNKGADETVLPGLVRRRAAELAIWREGDGKVSKVGWLALTRRGDKYILSVLDGDTAIAEHEWTTTAGLVALLRQYPDAGTTVVTKEDWQPPSKQLETSKPQPTTVYSLRLERTGKKEPQGCEELRLSIAGSSESWIVRSGQPWAQEFQPGGPSNRPGSMMPLPGGEYTVGTIEFAGGKDNYSKSWGQGLGPVWIGVEPNFSTRRSAFGIHEDLGAYGTAGCIGIRNTEELKSFVAAMRKFMPKVLRVVW